MKKLWKILLIILVVMVLSRFGWMKYEDYLYQKNFTDNQKQEPYSLRIPLEKMDFDVYKDYFTTISAPIEYNYTQSIILPCDVEYYNSKKSQNPILTLKKGTKIYVIEESGNSPIGYGLVCWPDYENGWRYGSPFLTENVVVDCGDLPMYFVKSKQLKAVAKSFYNANIKIFGRSVTASEFSELYTSYIDRILYDKGVFCAPK